VTAVEEPGTVDAEGVSAAEFREAMGQLPTGVAIVPSVGDDGETAGRQAAVFTHSTALCAPRDHYSEAGGPENGHTMRKVSVRGWSY
jgi:flavin reductase (DIM6/NTAB) family NADH-FMN oxidoreductase RutF